MEVTCSDSSEDTVDPQLDHELCRLQEHFETKRPHLTSCASQIQERRRKLRHEQSALDSLPLDLLAKEWLDYSSVNLSTRSYLASHLLPTLVMGLNSLLIEVSKQGLDNEPRPHHDFNPIDFLARYLMRNNPKHCRCPPEASPYNRSMRRIAEELKALLCSEEDKEMARLKAESKERTQRRLQQQEEKQREENRRVARLDDMFKLWELESGEGIPACQVRQYIVYTIPLYGIVAAKRDLINSSLI